MKKDIPALVEFLLDNGATVSHNGYKIHIEHEVSNISIELSQLNNNISDSMCFILKEKSTENRLSSALRVEDCQQALTKIWKTYERQCNSVVINAKGQDFFEKTKQSVLQALQGQITNDEHEMSLKKHGNTVNVELKDKLNAGMIRFEFITSPHMVLEPYWSVYGKAEIPLSKEEQNILMKVFIPKIHLNDYPVLGYLGNVKPSSQDMVGSFMQKLSNAKALSLMSAFNLSQTLEENKIPFKPKSKL